MSDVPPSSPTNDRLAVFRAPTRPTALGVPGYGQDGAIRSTQSMGVEEVQARVAAARVALDSVRRRTNPGATPVPPPPGTRPLQGGAADPPSSSPPVEFLSSEPSPDAAQASKPPAVPMHAPPSMTIQGFGEMHAPSFATVDSDPAPELVPPAPWEVDADVRGEGRITHVGPPTMPPGRVRTAGGPAIPVVVRRSAPARPPVLASDILREDLVPHEPGAERIRRIGALVGSVLIATPALAGTFDAAHLRNWSMPGVVALIAGLAPIRYVHRAVLTLAAALPALALVVLADTELSRGGAALTVALVATLPAALLFRLDFRASRRARAFVAVGVALGLVWLLLPGAGGVVAHRPGTWVEGHLAATSLIPLLVLSLLGFMGSNTTAGCGVWATGTVVWAALLALRPLLDPAIRRDGYLLRMLIGQSVALGALATLVAVALASAAAVYLRPTEPRQVFASDSD